MTDKKKNKLALVKVSDLNEKELDTAIDDALDFLFEESGDQESAKENKPAVKKPGKKDHWMQRILFDSGGQARSIRSGGE